METPESRSPSDDELKALLKDSSHRIERSDEVIRRHKAIYEELSVVLQRHGYEPLGLHSVRYANAMRETAIRLIDEELHERLALHNASAESYYEVLKGEHLDNLHQLTALILDNRHHMERGLILETVIAADEWDQNMQGVAPGSRESQRYFADIMERKKRLYADAVVACELGPDNPVVQTILAFLPGDIDPESDEMIEYLAHYFADNIDKEREYTAITQGAHELLGINIEDQKTPFEYEKIAAIHKMMERAKQFADTDIYRFEHALREQAQQLPFTASEVQSLIEYLTQVYADTLTSPRDEAE